MRSVHTERSTQSQFRGRASPACLAVSGTPAGLLRSLRDFTPSTFLHPLAPRALPRFLATMGALTPARRVLRASFRPMNAHLFRTGLPGSLVATFHAFRHQTPDAPCHRFSRCPPSVTGFPDRFGRFPGLDFTLNPQARRYARPNRVRPSYGLHVRLRLLPTPPHGDAVTFGYQERASPEGLSPLQSRLLQAHGFRIKSGNDCLPGTLIFTGHYSQTTPSTIPGTVKL